MNALLNSIGNLSQAKCDALYAKLRDPASDVNAFKLSYSQERLWLAHEFDPNTSAYNFGAALKLVGMLNIDVLNRALTEIIRRHEVLRTTLHSLGSERVQIIGAAYD